jgi:hypothetical protein
MKNETLVRWKPGYRFKHLSDADKVFEAVKKIVEQNGEITPEVLVEAAKKKTHACHKMIFELNEQDAAYEHRLERARYLLRHIEVKREETGNIPMRAYSVGKANFSPRQQSYRDTVELMKDPDERAELLKQALSKLVSIRRQYHHLQELAIVVRAIDEVLETSKP